MEEDEIELEIEIERRKGEFVGVLGVEVGRLWKRKRKLIERMRIDGKGVSEELEVSGSEGVDEKSVEREVRKVEE